MLTKTNPDGSWNICEMNWKDIPRELYGALCKLHDYEKTGLNPDEVERMAEKMQEAER